MGGSGSLPVETPHALEGNASLPGNKIVLALHFRLRALPARDLNHALEDFFAHLADAALPGN